MQAPHPLFVLRFGVRLTGAVASDLLNSLRESVIDFTRKSLDPAVFVDADGPKPVLRTQVAVFVMREINRLNIEGELLAVYLVGSICSYQWTPKSDIDVNIVVSDVGVKELKRRVVQATDSVILPGTQHAVNFFVHVGDVDLSIADGVYDVLEDVWIKGPYSISADLSKYVTAFDALVKKIDLDRGQLIRDVVDYTILQEMPEKDLKFVERMLDEKLQDIDEQAKSLANTYAILRSIRQTGFSTEISPEEAQEYYSKNLLPANVIYKLLERYHYNRFLLAVRKAIQSADGKIDSEKDVDKLKKAIGVSEMTTSGAVGSYEVPLRIRKSKRRKSLRKSVGKKIE